MRWLAFEYLLSFSFAACVGQQSQPFSGQGYHPPRNGSIDIWTSVFLDRLLAIDQTNYRHEHVLYVAFTWIDTRVPQMVANATTERLGSSCQRPCVTGGLDCCDTIWLPGVDIQNVFELPEGRTERHGIVFSQEGYNDGAVSWYQILHGVYYSTMNFRDFPFDEQTLKIEFSGQVGWNLTFLSSQSGEFEDQGLIGDDVSGWSFEQINIVPWKTSLPRNVSNSIKTIQLYNTSDSDPQPPFGTRASFAQYLASSGFVVDIIVQRNSMYYIFNVVTPIILTVLMCFTVYWIDPVLIEQRVTVVITLFLALTALQFVINDSLPSSSYFTPITIQILVSYTVLFLCVVESLFVFYLVNFDLVNDKHAYNVSMISKKSDKAMSNDEIHTKSSPAANHYHSARNSVGTLEGQDHCGSSSLTSTDDTPSPTSLSKEAHVTSKRNNELGSIVTPNSTNLLNTHDSSNTTIRTCDPMPMHEEMPMTNFSQTLAGGSSEERAFPEHKGRNNDGKWWQTLRRRHGMQQDISTLDVDTPKERWWNRCLGVVNSVRLLRQNSQRAQNVARIVDSASLFILLTSYIISVWLIFAIRIRDNDS
eukprot:CFRG5011T1